MNKKWLERLITENELLVALATQLGEAHAQDIYKIVWDALPQPEETPGTIVYHGGPPAPKWCYSPDLAGTWLRFYDSPNDSPGKFEVEDRHGMLVSLHAGQWVAFVDPPYTPTSIITQHRRPRWYGPIPEAPVGEIPPIKPGKGEG